MFTGLIEVIGIVEHIDFGIDSRDLRIAAPDILDSVHVKDSIAVNGCCLTVTRRDERTFDVTVIKETLEKTTLGALVVGNHVNLERAMRLQDRLGGHLVAGHIDTVGRIVNIVTNEAGCELWIQYPAAYRRNLIPVGSVCVDGISLTVASIVDPDHPEGMAAEYMFKVALIPHTIAVTTIGERQVGDLVNLEFDLIGKYALQMDAYRR